MSKQLGEAGATFSDVWSAYKSISGDACSNPQFTNQCAIRVSHALMECEVDLSGFKGTRCWNDSGNYNRKHIIRAEEFANWLSRAPLKGLGATVKADPAKFEDDLKGKKGIIFFKDYWQRGNESFANRSGDHIDLWDRHRTTGYWFSWSRDFTEWISGGTVSDQNKSKEIWFWSIP